MNDTKQGIRTVRATIIILSLGTESVKRRQAFVICTLSVSCMLSLDS
jgi:hypothetical protein